MYVVFFCAARLCLAQSQNNDGWLLKLSNGFISGLIIYMGICLTDANECFIKTLGLKADTISKNQIRWTDLTEPGRYSISNHLPLDCIRQYILRHLPH